MTKKKAKVQKKADDDSGEVDLSNLDKPTHHVLKLIAKSKTPLTRLQIYDMVSKHPGKPY